MEFSVFDAIFCSVFFFRRFFSFQPPSRSLSAYSHLSSFGCERQDIAKGLRFLFSIIFIYALLIVNYRDSEWVSGLHAKQNDSNAFNFCFKFFLFVFESCIGLYGGRLRCAYGLCSTPNRSKLVRMSDKNDSFGCFFPLQCWKMLYEQILTNCTRFLNPIFAHRSTWLFTSISQQAFVAWILFFCSFSSLSRRLPHLFLKWQSVVQWISALAHSMFSCVCVCILYMSTQCCCPLETQSSWYLYKLRLLPRSRAKHAHSKCET